MADDIADRRCIGFDVSVFAFFAPSEKLLAGVGQAFRSERTESRF